MAQPEFDNTKADGEGWGVFDCDGSDNGPWQIQRDDEAEVFEDDDEAWLHVLRRAKAGSAYHQAALDFVKEHNPIEAANIATFAARYSEFDRA